MDYARFAKIDKTLFISGASGTGKSCLAKKLHHLSSRSENPFIHINLCGLSPGLFESELFGHARGAFTGAHSAKRGFAEIVGRGTLFLDEVGELSLEMQAKLLMLLEEGIFRSVGCCAPKRFEGRIMFATNRDLEKMVESGEFREDLFFRLRTYELRLPRLVEDHGLLERIEIAFCNAKCKRSSSNSVLGEELLGFLRSYSWPGNFRELNNVMEYLVLMGDGHLSLSDLPPYLKKSTQDSGNYKAGESSYHGALESFERVYLAQELRKRDYMINKTAREIKISKVTLLSKIKKYDIKKRLKYDSNRNLREEAI